LWKQHEAQQSQLIPPTWQRRKLSLQATSVIANSKDPLMTLEEVSLNLPSVASTLVHTKIPDNIQEVAEKLEEDLGQSLPSMEALLVNGRQINIDRPTFNVFELLNLLRKEQRALAKLQNELGPYLPNAATLQKVKDAWSMGKDFLDIYGAAAGDGDDMGDDPMGSDSTAKVYRIDVGHGWKKAVMYLNDVEKDAKYAQWPKQVRQVFMAMQFGMPPSIRRNLFTMLAVMDPIDNVDNVGMTLAKQLMQSNYPARLGILLVDNEDVKKCAEWVAANPDSEEGESCPVYQLPILTDEVTEADKEVLKEMSGSTRALHRLFADVITNNPKDMADAYLEFALKSIEEQLELSGEISLFDILHIHATVMNGMGAGATSNVWKDASSLLTKKDDEDEDDKTSPTYGKALRFAVDKGLQAGMSFLNGRALPVGDPEEVFEIAGKAFNAEMQHVFKMIQTGEIKDSTPRSVYGKFLSGKGVFKKVHPLLMDTKDKSDSYIKIKHDFDSKSLLFPSAPADAPDAVFVIDAALDLGSTQGLQIAKSLVSVMDSFPASLADDGDKSVSIKIGYRIIPSKASDEARALCPILAYAGEVGAAAITLVLEKAATTEGQSLTLEDYLSVAPGLSDSLKEKIRSDNTEGACSRLATLNDLPGENLVASNGMFYALKSSSLAKDDIELLLSLDLEFARAVTSYMKSDVPANTPEGCESISRATTFLAMESAVAQSDRSGLEQEIMALEKKIGIDKNPLRFSWNDGESDQLQVGRAPDVTFPPPAILLTSLSCFFYTSVFS